MCSELQERCLYNCENRVLSHIYHANELGYELVRLKPYVAFLYFQYMLHQSRDLHAVTQFHNKKIKKTKLSEY